MIVSLLCTLGNTHAADVKLSPVYTNPEDQRSLSPGLEVIDLSREQKFVRLSDALKSINRLQILDSGVPGDPVLVSIQGASSQQTQLLINGVPTHSSQWGTYDINILPIDFVERIEIHTSSQETSINQGIGGTINIITKKQVPSSIRLGLGSYGIRRFGIHQSITQDQLLSVTHQQFDNDYQLPIASPFNNPQTQNQKQALNNADFSKTSAHYHYHHELGDIGMSATHSKKAIPDYFRNSPLNKARLDKTSYEIHFQSEKQRLFQQRDFWQHLHINLKTEKENFKDIEGSIGLRSNDDIYQQHQFELGWQPSYSSEQVYGFLDFSSKLNQFNSRHRLDSDSFLCSNPQGSCDQEAEQFQLNSGASLTWFSQNQAHSVTTQIGLLQVNQQNKERNGNKQNQSENVYDQQAINYQFDAGDLVLGKLTLKLGFEKNTRIPSLFERFGDRGLLIGSEDLEAETGSKWFIELPYQYQQFSLEASFFHRNLDNAIVAVYDSRGIGRYENTSQATMLGLELKARIDGDTWYSQVSTSQYDSETQSVQVKSFNDKQLSGVYHSTIQAQLGFFHNKWKGNLEYQYADNLYIDRSNLVKGDQRSIANAHLEYDISRFSLTLSIKNLTNNQFKDYSNRPIVGRQWMINSTYYF